MAGKLTASETNQLITSLDRIKELTDLLRRAHLDVPYHTVYGAVGAEMVMRGILLRAALADVEVETIERKAA